MPTSGMRATSTKPSERCSAMLMFILGVDPTDHDVKLTLARDLDEVLQNRFSDPFSLGGRIDVKRVLDGESIAVKRAKGAKGSVANNLVHLTSDHHRPIAIYLGLPPIGDIDLRLRLIVPDGGRLLDGVVHDGADCRRSAWVASLMVMPLTGTGPSVSDGS